MNKKVEVDDPNINSDEIKKYPDASVNSNKFDKEYALKTTIIAFDDIESENIERFLEKLNYPTWEKISSQEEIFL